MNRIMIAGAFLLLYSTTSFSQHQPSKYSGQETRQIKSLSEVEVQGYLKGHGLGFAKAAELNHYPGPKHVLDLTEPLTLTEQQIEQTREIFRVMQKKATALGSAYIDKERELDRLFAQAIVDSLALKEVVFELGRLRSSIRLAHLSAHLQMKQVLSPAQVNHYDKLRGYLDNTSHKTQHHE